MITGYYDEPMASEAADLHERDGQTDLAWVQRLTPNEATGALAFLVGLDPETFQMVVDHVEEWRRRRAAQSTAPVPAGKDG